VSVLNTVLLIVWFISVIALILLVLMHSGKGTGLSDMIASSVYNSQSGTGVLERNLDRLTLIFAIIFVVICLVFMITYPQGTIA
jgi:preprotein translocase subunit SecG